MLPEQLPWMPQTELDRLMRLYGSQRSTEMSSGPYYDRALKALQAAHDACFNAPGRDVLGMTHGPFSGVNEVLGIVAELESKTKRPD